MTAKAEMLDGDAWLPRDSDARQKLETAFKLFSEGCTDPAGDVYDVENGVATVLEGMTIDTEEDAIIACSAIYARLHDLSTNEIHPHSQVGIDMRSVISMFAYIAMKHAFNGMGVETVEEYERHIPEWIR